MKIKDMNAHQKKAYLMLKDLYNDGVGGYENALIDYPEDSEEYKEAQEVLADRDGIKADVYAETISIAEKQGSLRHIKFAGKEWMMERIEELLQKDGY